MRIVNDLVIFHNPLPFMSCGMISMIGMIGLSPLLAPYILIPDHPDLPDLPDFPPSPRGQIQLNPQGPIHITQPIRDARFQRRRVGIHRH